MFSMAGRPLGIVTSAVASSATLELRAHHEELVKLFHVAGVRVTDELLLETFMLLHCKVPVDVVLDMFKDVENKDIEYHDIITSSKSRSQNT